MNGQNARWSHTINLNKGFDMENLYHLYFDEGGILGDATVLITSKKLRVSKTKNHISWYYVGKLTNSAITAHLARFKQLYPNCKIDYTKRIEVDFKEILKFPREMLVSINGTEWFKRIVFGKVKSIKPFIIPVFEKDTEGRLVMGVKFAKEIQTSPYDNCQNRSSQE